MSSKLRSVASLSESLRRGRGVLRLAHQEQDSQKRGTLRAGNSGLLSHTGEFAGCCPHVAHLRQIGIEAEGHTDSKLIMFQMGVESENAVFRDLAAQLPEGQVLLRESETPINWLTKNGTPVSGRPDGVIYERTTEILGRTDINGVELSQVSAVKLRPHYGVELKTVASFWTTRNILLERMPKLEHLCQVAHYAWKLGIPYKLSYKNYVNQIIPPYKWILPLIPRKGDPLSGCIDYNEYGKAKNVAPYEITYEIDIDEHGFVWFRLEQIETIWRKSIVNIRDVERFYDFVSEIPHTKKLGSKRTTINSVGTELDYSHCDKYCPIHMQFSQFEHDYDLWLSHIKYAAELPGGIRKGEE